MFVCHSALSDSFLSVSVTVPWWCRRCCELWARPMPLLPAMLRPADWRCWCHFTSACLLFFFFVCLILILTFCIPSYSNCNPLKVASISLASLPLLTTEWIDGLSARSNYRCSIPANCCFMCHLLVSFDLLSFVTFSFYGKLWWCHGCDTFQVVAFRASKCYRISQCDCTPT